MPEKENYGGVLIVTTPFIPNREVKEVRGIVWASTVKSKFILQEIVATVRIMLGGDIHEYWELIDEARRQVMKETVLNAKKMDADAVINFKITTSQIVGGTIEILGYGTAVKLK